MVLCVLNVVVGAFVATTAEISSRDRDAVVKAELGRYARYASKIKTFFCEADEDNSGYLSWDEFKQHLQDTRVKAYFQALELDVSQARTLFKLLDKDGSNQLTLDEFLEGCLRLKGQARSIDVNMLLYTTGQLQRRVEEYMASSLEAFASIQSKISPTS